MSAEFDLFATVILDGQAVKPLDYGIPSHLKNDIEEGSRVLVTLRKKEVKGTVLYVRKKSPLKNVQPLLEVLMNKQKIPDDLFNLASWMSKYYATPIRSTLKCILPAPVRDDKGAKQKIFIKRALSKPKTTAACRDLRAKHPSQATVLEAMLRHDKGIFLTDLLEETKISQSPIDTLVKNKMLTKELHTIDRTTLLNDAYFPTLPKRLNSEQQAAYESIAASIDSGEFHTHLLHGVTGSGKTEVYLQLIQRALEGDKSVILLVPEIALTAQTIERIKGRFQSGVAILHYRLSEGERLDAWNNIRDGSVKIVVGARSAIFSPLPNLGLIIVDEEQDGSYKQTDEMPCYNARDLAIVRAKLTGCVALLGSATPSLETYRNALDGKYHLDSLQSRASQSSLPTVSIIDMRLDREGSTNHRFFSETLLSKMRACVAKGEQVILFLNRRGTYSILKCEKCEHALECPHCDQTLTFHRSAQHLSCHLCGYTLTPPPTICPSCHSGETIKFKGPGTDQIERSLNAMFPDIRTLRMDGDTTRKKGAHDRLFKQFRSGKADVLIGTQMIAKGLHFPSVTLVGVLNSDGALNIPDFRSFENVFQLITQVSGRAGRSELKGEVVLQTRIPEHPLFSFASKEDYHGFYKHEIASRKLFSYPPFHHIVKLTISSTDEKQAFEFGKAFRSQLIQKLPNSFNITPVVPCSLSKIKDRFRFQFLVNGEKIMQASVAIQKLNEATQRPRGVGLTVDVDPRDTL